VTRHVLIVYGATVICNITVFWIGAWGSLFSGLAISAVSTETLVDPSWLTGWNMCATFETSFASRLSGSLETLNYCRGSRLAVLSGVMTYALWNPARPLGIYADALACAGGASAVRA
jgi:hypothetical protein